MVSTGCLLCAGLAGDDDPWTPAHCRQGESARVERSDDRDFESHYAARRYGIDSCVASDKIPAPVGAGDGRRDAAADAEAAARMVFCEALGVPTRVFSGDGAVQCVSAAAIFGISRELSICRRIRGPRV